MSFYFFIFLDYFNASMLKIFFKNKKNIILIYFQIKILKKKSLTQYFSTIKL
jgi:hypothetical protein